ncbi:MAG: hypothetical protein C3F11_16815 [Methylocystaceae bacterium]|nr:MAG: hypothetical protein C3F11_16815 [Methylocystaceae bacterium]
MVYFVRLVTLTLEAVLLQLVNGIGLVALSVAAVAGFFRAPLWSIFVFALVFGFGVDFFEGWVSFSDKAAGASERWAFVVPIYLLIVLSGYLTGVVGRHYVERRKKKAAAQSQ